MDVNIDVIQYRLEPEHDAVKTMVTKWVFIIHNSKKNSCKTL
jgi:hypothetical protein